MPRLGHGRPITEDGVNLARTELEEFSVRSPVSFALTPPVDTHGFDLLFPTLQEDDANLLPQLPDTPEKLKALGRTMVDTNPRGEDSPIPAAYTYLGQFIDHDITLEAHQGDGGTIGDLLADGMTPLSLEQIRSALKNLRSATLDLDSLYGLPAPHDPANNAKLRIGVVDTATGNRPPGKSDDNDLPREPRQPGDPARDRAALIGDPRNDENLIISQLHVAFLKAHNVLVEHGLSFEAARRLLRQHYQHVVVQDFLKRIADPAIVDDIVTNGNRWFDPYAQPFFMPLEFAAGAYRIGHTMVRANYNFNLNFKVDTRPPASLELLFVFTALSGELGDFDTLPENWIIEWENIVGEGSMNARRIDTLVATEGDRALFGLRTVTGEKEEPPDAARLPVRNLLRGYRLRLPTGQAVAHLLDVPTLTKDELIAAVTPQQAAALEDGGFTTRTPLWFYILAEANHFANGERLGPVGSTVVAEVLVGLVRRSTDSILRTPGWTPTLPARTPGAFELADLLRLAGVLPGQQAPTTYTVQRGDTLFRIAETQLGDGNRWPQIFVLNRNVIRNPNQIFAGQVLVLPPAQPGAPIPRLYVVKRGDTLSGIAGAELNDANHWREIFALNGDIITNPDRIIPGQVLVLPT